GLADFFAGVHDEWSVVCDGRADRQSTEQQHVVRVTFGGGDDKVIPGAEDGELTVGEGSGVGTDVASSGEDVGEGSEVATPRHQELRAGRQGRVRVSNGCVRDTGAFEGGDVPCDETNQCAAVVAGEQAQ